MTNEKFTLGEWTAEFTRVRFPNGERMWVGCGDVYTKIANAHLISAAPDMYRMLEFLHTIVGAGSVALEIDKVLKKARGEE